MSSGYAKKRAVLVMHRSELVDLHTGTLLARMKRLRACLDSLEQDESMLITEEYQATHPDLIWFKSDPRWKIAHSDLKSILSNRPHMEKKP